VRRAGWSSRSLGSRLQHEFFYALIRLGGSRAAYVFLAVVAFCYTLMPSVRARSAPYLSRRFPGCGRAARFVQALRLNFEFGKVLVDRAATGITGLCHVEPDGDGRELFTRLLARGRGLMVVTAHAGAWQWAMSGLDFTGRRLNVLYRRDPGDVDRQYFEHADNAAAPRFIDPCSDFGGVIEVTAALRAGEVVCAMGDRIMGGPGNTVRASYLGGEVSLPVGPFAIAARLGAPVAVVFAPRTGPGRARVLVDWHQEDASTADPADMARDFARSLERFSLAEPFQAYNFYDLWAGPDAGPDNAQPSSRG